MGRLLGPDFNPYQALWDWLRAQISNPLDLIHDPQLGLYVLIVVGVVLMFVGRKRNQSQQQRQSESDKEVTRQTNTSLARRIWWRIRPPVDVMRVDGLVIDRSRKPHCGWFGPTGAGKSAAVATVRVNGERPTLIVTPDVSDPMREATLRLGGFVWTACVSSTPIDFLIGEPTEVAERLTKVFRSGGQGVWMRAARRATAEVIRTIDADDEPRTLKLIGERLAIAVKSDRELKAACAMWVERFLDAADQFGDSLGPDGVDIADLLRQGKTVLVDNDAFDHLALGGDVVAFVLADAQRCARLVPGGFRLIFEEAGQLGERIDLAEPFHRAGRRRKVATDDITQSEDDLNEGISSNLGTRVYFAQEKKSLQKIAADRLEIDYQELSPAKLKDFHAYVAHGRIRRLVHFPKPPKPSAPQNRQPTSVYPHPQPNPESVRHGHALEIRELPVYREPLETLPALPPPGDEYLTLQDNIYLDGECERWSGKHDRAGHKTGCRADCSIKAHARTGHNEGCLTDCAIQDHLDNCYGLVWWPLAEPTESRTHEWQRIHRVRYRMAYGPIPLDPKTGRPQTIDHRRTCPKDCSKLGHLNGPVTRSENSLRSWRTGDRQRAGA